jgi:hypothetical protein
MKRRKRVKEVRRKHRCKGKEEREEGEMLLIGRGEVRNR